MNTLESTAPKITADLMRRVLGHAQSVVVWLPAIDACDVADTGLTKAQATNPAIVPVVTHEEALAYLDGVDGDHARAARIITATLGARHARGQL